MAQRVPRWLSLEGVRLIALKTNPWTIEQILSLSESEHHIRSARNFAVASRWHNLGTDGKYIWGELEQKEDLSYLSGIQISPLKLSCSCLQRIYPCHHVVALGILYLNDDIELAKRPKWLKEFKAIKTSSKKTNDTKRLELIKQGLNKTERWLEDIIGHGLEPIRHKKPNYYAEHAKNLVDIGAYRLAKEVESWALIKTNWAEEILGRIAKLHLIIQAFNNYENLNPNLQADLRSAVDWQLAINMTKIVDNWQVLGHFKEQHNKRSSQNIYLYSANLQNYALIKNKLYKKENLNTSLYTGLNIELSLSFYPSANPLQAELVSYGQVLPSPKPDFGFTSIKQALSDYAKKKAANPFLDSYPMALLNIELVKIKDDWFLIDNEGYVLKLIKKFSHAWHLKAIAKDQPLWLFGIWQNYEYKPLSVYSGGRIVDLKILRGGK